MTIFLVTITVILFILRLRSTPKMISKKAYMRRMQEIIKKNQLSFEKIKDEKVIELAKISAIVFIVVIKCLLGLYYIILGTHIGLLYFTILTVLQILTIIETCKRQLNMKAFSLDITDFKFYRWYFLFNVLLDLIYYPLAIYLLLK